MWRILFNRRTSRAASLLIFWLLAFLAFLYMSTIMTVVNMPAESQVFSKQDVDSNPYQHIDPGSIAQYRFDRYAHRSNSDLDSDDRPGGMGRPHSLNLEGADREIEANLTAKEGCNVLVSNEIPFDRTLPDLRESFCQTVEYDIASLPTTSIVFIFCNEPWSVFMRSVHSVINRSPPQLLKEVILVDDFSDRPELTGSQVDDYARKEWPDGVVKVIHLKERSGLIVARQRGAEAAIGDVIVFMDAHIEASEGWLEPLLQRIKEKRTAVVCSLIPPIITDNFSLMSGMPVGYIGSFVWGLSFKWEPAPPREIRRRKNPTDTYLSPVMLGALIAVERNLGGFDTGMDIWGAEHIEMSFRTWMCGGSVEFAPCSQVGHMYRVVRPYSDRDGKNTEGINSVRLAEAWMDDYKRLFYWNRDPLKAEMGGDISERLAIRKKLNCKSFKWYLYHVYPEKFILDEQALGFGYVMNEVRGQKLCLDLLGHGEDVTFALGLYNCHDFRAISQFFSFSLWNELRRDESCASIFGLTGNQMPVMMRRCMRETDKIPADSDQLWWYKPVDGHIVHQQTGLCLTTRNLVSGSDVLAVTCETSDDHQVWKFETWKPGDPASYNVTFPPPVTV